MTTEAFDHEYDLDSLETITPKGRDFQMLVTPRWLTYLSHNAHEDFTSDLLLSFIRDDTLFIDVGAHYGYYTVLVGASYPNCRIIAFEPVPESCEILRRNMKLNQLKNVKVHNTALSNKNENMKFNIMEASDCSGFHKNPISRVRKVVELEAATLDSVITEVPEVPVVIKVDTEGHEICALEGMDRILKHAVDVKLIVEFNPKCLRSAGYEPSALLRRILEFGFEIYFVDDDKRIVHKLAEENIDSWTDYVLEKGSTPGSKTYINLLCLKASAELDEILCRDELSYGHCDQKNEAHEIGRISKKGELVVGAKMRIAAIAMVYNEAFLLPYFLRHYQDLDEIHVLYETDSTDDTLKILKQASNVIIKNCHIAGGLDSTEKVKLTNDTLHTIEADWVYVVDCDEFIFPPHESAEDFLGRQDCENHNVVRAGMFQVYRHRTDRDLDPALPPTPQRVHGDPDLFSTAEGPNKPRNALYVKPIIVKPSSEIRFQPGNHFIEGDIRVSSEFYLGAHWHMADPSLAIDRKLKNRARISERNKKLGHGWHYQNVTEKWIREECDRHLDDPLIEELALFGNKSLRKHELLTMRLMYKATTFDLEKQRRQLENQRKQLQELNAALESKDARIHSLDLHIRQVERSIPMQVVRRYQRVVDRLLRPGTRRRRPYDLALTGVRVILNEGWRSFFRAVRAHLRGDSARGDGNDE